MTSPHLKEEDARSRSHAARERSRVGVSGTGEGEPRAPPPAALPPPPLHLIAQPTEPRPHDPNWELRIPAPAIRAVARCLPVSPMMMYLKR